MVEGSLLPPWDLGLGSGTSHTVLSQERNSGLVVSGNASKVSACRYGCSKLFYILNDYIHRDTQIHIQIHRDMQCKKQTHTHAHIHIHHRQTHTHTHTHTLLSTSTFRVKLINES